MSTKLYVGNLSYDTTENDLQDLFAPHGTVVGAQLIMDKMSGRSRGFGFVEMDSPEGAVKAIEMFNGHDLQNRQIIVNEARPQTPRPTRASASQTPLPA